MEVLEGLWQWVGNLSFSLESFQHEDITVPLVKKSSFNDPQLQNSPINPQLLELPNIKQH